VRPAVHAMRMATRTRAGSWRSPTRLRSDGAAIVDMRQVCRALRRTGHHGYVVAANRWIWSVGPATMSSDFRGTTVSGSA
jgi:hypothetical protein